MRFELLGQAEHERELCAWHGGFHHACVVREAVVLQPCFGDDGIELVMTQVGRDGHALDAGFGVLQRERGFVKRGVERHGGAVTAFLQGVALHHLVGQHGDFVARHVDGGQALATQLINRVARLQGQRRCSDVDAQRDGAAAQTLHRQGVVNLGGLRVVDRVGLHMRQWQRVCNRRRLQARKARALREVIKQKALPMKLICRSDGARLL